MKEIIHSPRVVIDEGWATRRVEAQIAAVSTTTAGAEESLVRLELT